MDLAPDHLVQLEEMKQSLVVERERGCGLDRLPQSISLFGKRHYSNFFQSTLCVGSPSALIIQCDIDECEPLAPLSQDVCVWETHLSCQQVSDLLTTRYTFNTHKVKDIHAGLAIVDGIGVVVSGQSGSGKTHLLRQLLNDGHILVSDDVVEVFRGVDGRLMGKAPLAIFNMIHRHGARFDRVSQRWGRNAVRLFSTIELMFDIDTDRHKNGANSLIDIYKKIDNYKSSKGCLTIGILPT